MDINTPIPEAWRDYVTQLPAGLEIRPGVLYDTVNYVSGITQKLTYFARVGVPENITNMETAGSLADPKSMLIQNMRVKFLTPLQSDAIGDGDSTPAASGFNDVIQLSDTGIFRLRIGEKDYGPWPIWMLPVSNFVKGNVALLGSTAQNVNYGQLDGPLYPLFPNLMLSPRQQFKVVLEWPSGPVTLSTGSESELPIEVVFDGQISAAIQ